MAMARVTSFLLLCLYLLSACSRARTGGLIAEVTPPAPALNPLPTVEAAPLAAASTSTVAPPASPMPTASVTPTPTPSPTFTPSPTNTPTPVPFGARFVVGRSAQDREIESYQFGNGPLPVILVGGIHGGYEWNSILLAYGLMDYLTENPQLVPPEMTIHIIPAANPDGQAAVVGHDGRFTQDELAADTVPGRFNGNGVDLNRNWPCAWEPEGIWRNQPVNAGPYPFSEPENVALRDFILAQQPVVVVFYHSAFDALFTAGCPDVHPPSRAMAEVYGRAADYPVFDHFAAYPVTGDAGDWLATQGIPNFTVELSTHFNLDWSRNLAGFQALLAHLTP